MWDILLVVSSDRVLLLVTRLSRTASSLVEAKASASMPEVNCASKEGAEEWKAPQAREEEKGTGQ